MMEQTQDYFEQDATMIDWISDDVRDTFKDCVPEGLDMATWLAQVPSTGWSDISWEQGNGSDHHSAASSGNRHVAEVAPDVAVDMSNQLLSADDYSLFKAQAPVAEPALLSPPAIAHDSSSAQGSRFAAATALLLSLFPAGNDSKRLSMLDFEAVLTRNREVIDGIIDIGAQHGTQDRWMNSILSLILLKILACYEAVAAGRTLQSKQSIGETRSSAEYIRAQHRKTAKAVMAELLRVQQLIWLFEGDFRGMDATKSKGGGDRSGAEQDWVLTSNAGISERTVNKLSEEVHARFRAVSTAIIERLRML